MPGVLDLLHSHDSDSEASSHRGAAPEANDDDNSNDNDDDASDSDLDGVRAENAALKRRLRTEPARRAKAVKRAKSLAQGAQTKPDESEQAGGYQEKLQKLYFTSEFNPHAKESGSWQVVRDRARCVWSLLRQLQSVVTKLLCNAGEVHHVLHCCVCDDTSTRLRQAGSASGTVHTVCNTVEATLVRYADGESEILYIPTPVRVLDSGRADAIRDALQTWSLVTANGFGAMWSKFGLPANTGMNAKWRTFVFVGDALKANDAAWAYETQVKNRTSLGVRIKCANHQLSLVRRPAVLSVERFWSTLVRLGHLYENSSFRKALARSLVKLLHEDGGFVRV